MGNIRVVSNSNAVLCFIRKRVNYVECTPHLNLCDSERENGNPILNRNVCTHVTNYRAFSKQRVFGAYLRCSPDEGKHSRSILLGSWPVQINDEFIAMEVCILRYA